MSWGFNMKQVVGYDAVRYAESVLRGDYVFQGGDALQYVPISFTMYVIRTERDYILVDAGCDDLPGFNMENMIGPVEALKRIGLKPDDISKIIITHAHQDHIAGLEHFPYSVVIIQEQEYKIGKRFIPSTCKIVTFKEEYIVDDCIKVVKIGGHTIGSCIVEFSFMGELYIICGDECHTSDCFRKNIPNGISFSLQKSKYFLEKYGTGEYRVLMCHDYDSNEVKFEKDIEV